jgi:hypothetical protein
MADQIIDAVMARSIQADAERKYPLLGWVVMRDHPDYPGELIARFVADAPTPYVLVSDTLAGLHAQLPIGLVRSEHQPSDPPEVVEVWLPPA